MKIGIIGAGQIGATLARKLSATGHTVLLANSRGPDTIRAVAEEASATAVTATAAARNADVVIVSIPQKSVPFLAKDLFHGVSDEVVVVDTGNYYPGMRDEPTQAIERGMPESRWVSEQLGRPVVKAFNSITAYSLANKGKAAGVKGRIALPVSGDNVRAKNIVMALVDAIGFDGVDAGLLDESWRHQPGTPACCTDLETDDLRRALSEADRTQAAKVRDLALQKMGQLGASITNDDLVRISRSLHGW
jgi:hypothetical protein